MTGTVKKTKAPAKARKPATKKVKIDSTCKTYRCRLARRLKDSLELWAQRGYQDGFAEQDWLRAEQELLQMAS